MSSDLPEYYFRIRENGAQVFRMDAENRQRRIDMEPLAVLNIRKSDVKPQGDRELTEVDLVVIRNWMEERQELLAARDMDDIHPAIDSQNLTA